MKKISYKFCVKANYGTEENPNYVEAFVDKTLICHTDEEYEKSLPIAKQEAYNGEYIVEDDGVEEIVTPTTEERVEALEAAVTMLCMPDASEV